MKNTDKKEDRNSMKKNGAGMVERKSGKRRTMNRIVAGVLAAAMLLSTAVMVFGAEEEQEQTAVKNLSLEQTIEIMQNEGLRAQTATINKQSDQAIASGYNQTAREIADAMRNMSGGGIGTSVALEAAGATSVNQRVARLRSQFATENIDNNYQAELNQIATDTISLYYSLLLSQAQFDAAKNNLQVVRDVLDNTQRKYELGTVAQIDLTSAEVAVESAESEVITASKNLDSLRLSFNQQMGFPLNQNVNLTDKLEKKAFPEASLSEAVENAQKSRLEIPAARLAMEVNEIVLDNLRLTTSSSSSTYKNQQISYLWSIQSYETAPDRIEVDVRTKYYDLQSKNSAVDAAKSSMDLAAEGYTIALAKYELGMCTLTEVQDAQQKVFLSELSLAAAVSDFNLAVYAYEYAQGIGTERISL